MIELYQFGSAKLYGHGLISAAADYASKTRFGVTGGGLDKIIIGFVGATGIFEVLPFTEPVRARIARSDTASELAAAARAAGMRSMMVSGLAKVRNGDVSAEELDRVLRFSE